MLAMQLTSPDLSRRQAPGRSTAAVAQDGEPAGMLPPDQPPTALDEPATVTAQFQPLDPGIVNEAIPAFFIGRNKEGFWVARDIKGQLGGIFLLENSAVSFARRNSLPAGCATIYPHDRIELDLENKGNPFAVHLVSILRLTKRPRRRIAALIAKMTEAVKRRLRDFHAF
jgi:hypothetical protein